MYASPLTGSATGDASIFELDCWYPSGPSIERSSALCGWVPTSMGDSGTNGDGAERGSGETDCAESDPGVCCSAALPGLGGGGTLILSDGVVTGIGGSCEWR